jgi:hypothetical protein
VIWLHSDVLTVEYQETPLAQYTVRYQPDKKLFKAIPDARRFETPYSSLQGRLWELDETMWHRALRLPDYAPAMRNAKKSLCQYNYLVRRSTSSSGVILHSSDFQWQSCRLFLEMSSVKTVGFLGEIAQETNGEARRNISHARDARAALERATKQGSHRER